MQSIWRVAVGLLVAVLMLAGGAVQAAQSADPAPNGDDEAKLRQCLEAVRKAASDPRACLGVVADPCLEQPGDTTAQAMLDCISRETALWERMLTDRFGDLVREVSEAARDRVHEVHHAWIDYRDQRCSLGKVLFSRDSMADVWAADCLLQETGRRAIEIRLLLEELNAR